MKTRISSVIISMFMLACITVSCDDGLVEYDVYGSISGMVTDRDTGQPIQDVEVWTSPSTHTFTTGFDGTFVFLKLDARQYEVWAQKPGYYTNHKTVTTIAGDNVFASLPLQKK